MIYQRRIYDKLKLHLSKKQYTIIVGARQTGKTTLLRQLFKETEKTENSVPYYLSFEDLTLLNEINKDPENIFKFANKIFESHPNKKLYLFIDEVQYAENPSHFLKYLYDKYEEKIKITATGSSAFYIDTKFKDSLSGRKRIFHLTHLNFPEYLIFNKKEELSHELELIRNNNNYISAKRADINYMFEEYLIFGGYPSVALETDLEEKVFLLKELKDSYLKKDIGEASVSYPGKFMQLMLLLSEQTGNLVNRNELSNSLRLDNKTVQSYLEVMQKSFHISLVQPFSRNKRKEISKMPKLYFQDLGMRNVLLNNFQAISARFDKGHILENYFFNRLSELYPPENIKFWRTSSGNEVDFVVLDSFSKGKAFEIKYNAEKLSPKKYQIFTSNYPKIPLEFISYENNKPEVSKNILAV